MLPNEPLSSPTRRRNRWIYPLVLLIAAPAVYFGMTYFKGDSTVSQLKTDLVKAIHDQNGTDVEILSLKQDNNVGPKPGDGYSGTGRVKPNGPDFTIEAWLEHYFNKSGEGSMIHWSLKPTAPATTSTK